MHDFVTKLQEPTKDMMVFYGAGDHGGGPAKETIHAILDAQKQPGAPKIIFSTPDSYFDDIARPRPRSEVRSPMDSSPVPVVDDDLQHHSVGCYTAVSEIKKDNRTAEAALMTGEKMAALANVLVGFPYPKSDFTASWKKVLLMQFHDSMAGTALPEAVRRFARCLRIRRGSGQSSHLPRGGEDCLADSHHRPCLGVPGGFQSSRLGGEAERSI